MSLKDRLDDISGGHLPLIPPVTWCFDLPLRDFELLRDFTFQAAAEVQFASLEAHFIV